MNTSFENFGFCLKFNVSLYMITHTQKQLKTIKNNLQNPVKPKSDLKHGHKGVVNSIFRRAFELNQELFTRNHI